MLESQEMRYWQFLALILLSVTIMSLGRKGRLAPSVRLKTVHSLRAETAGVICQLGGAGTGWLLFSSCTAPDKEPQEHILPSQKHQNSVDSVKSITIDTNCFHSNSIGFSCSVYPHRGATAVAARLNSVKIFLFQKLISKNQHATH